MGSNARTPFRLLVSPFFHSCDEDSSVTLKLWGWVLSTNGSKHVVALNSPDLHQSDSDMLLDILSNCRALANAECCELVSIQTLFANMFQFCIVRSQIQNDQLLRFNGDL